ncbi:MAG: hypothetical protein IJV02_00715 [Candidatus Methanomethylophilaceae archaeon]|nr:hypothetical protein [Candidatus Methanomethylophilaceae archaeon]
MATDEEIHKFVNDNRELVERMMTVQKENAEMAKAIGKDVIKLGFESTYIAADFARRKSEEFFVRTYKMITNPEVQRHFMASGLEFLAGLTALAENAPMPSFMREAAVGVQKNARAAACMINEDCPAKAKRIDAPSEEVSAVEIRSEPEPAKAESAQ